MAPSKAVVGVDRPMKAPSMHLQKLLGENCLSSNSCHYVKNYFFQAKIPHAYVQYVCIVAPKYQFAPSKAVVGVDQPIKALSMHIQPDSFMHMFNVSILYRQSIKLLH